MPFTCYRMASGRQGITHPKPRPVSPPLWIFGGSPTRGISADHGHTMPSFPARVLDQETPTLPARVFNLDNDGYNSLLETKYLQEMLIESPLSPRLIVFYDGANDAAYFARYLTLQAHHGYRQVRGLIESYHSSWFGIFKAFNAAWYTSSTREFNGGKNQGEVWAPLESARISRISPKGVPGWRFSQSQSLPFSGNEIQSFIYDLRQ